MSGSRTDVACDLCGSRFTDLRHSGGGIRVVQCRVCDLVYLNPRDEGAIAERNRTRDLVAHFAPVAARQRAHFGPRLDRIAAILGRKGRLLDIGCAAGNFMSLAREQGWEVTGVDVNLPAATYARDTLGLDVLNGSLADLPADRGSFDAATLWDVLEHVPDPRDLIVRARERLADGGVLALSVPNVASLAAWRAGERWPMYGDEHFTYFTPETIRKMVRLSGFEVIRVETHGLGRCFLGPGKDEASADSLGAAYDRSRHRRGVIFAERVLDRLLDLIQAGQVIHLYARRREPKAPEPLRGPRARPGRRGSRQRGLFS